MHRSLNNFKYWTFYWKCTWIWNGKDGNILLYLIEFPWFWEDWFEMEDDKTVISDSNSIHIIIISELFRTKINNTEFLNIFIHYFVWYGNKSLV